MSISADEQKTAVQRLTLKDEAALQELYQQYGPVLYAVARRITGDPGVAEEVIQDTFFQLWCKAGEFDSARGTLIGWLLVMTRHRAISRIRENQRRASRPSQRAGDEVPAIQPTALEREIARELVSIGLSELSARQRDAVMLAYLEGLTCDEIAHRTGVPPTTTHTRLRTAVQVMKKALNGRRPKNNPNRQPSLYDILVTDSLDSRTCRRRDPSEERVAIASLGEAAKHGCQELIDCFLRIANDLCRSGSSGLSFLEPTSGTEQVFRWTNLAGELAQYIGETTPRNFSPCGVTLDRGYPQLFRYPARYFTYFQKVTIPLVEGLVIPFHVGDRTHGSVWIVTHEEGTGFDVEDVRIMTGLTEFVSCALHVNRSLGVVV